MNLDIKPKIGVGPLQLGMTRAAVRAALEGRFDQISRARTLEYPTDVFFDSSLFAYYDADGLLEAVELARPLSPMLDGVDLLSLGYTAACTLLRRTDPALETDTGGATSFGLGVGLYAPAALEEPDEPAEAVIVFQDGLYDQ